MVEEVELIRTVGKLDKGEKEKKLVLPKMCHWTITISFYIWRELVCIYFMQQSAYAVGCNTGNTACRSLQSIWFILLASELHRHYLTSVYSFWSLFLHQVPIYWSITHTPLMIADIIRKRHNQSNKHFLWICYDFWLFTSGIFENSLTCTQNHEFQII